MSAHRCLRSVCAFAFCVMLCAAAGPVAGEPKISAGGLFSDKAMLTIDGRQRLLKVGETSPEGVTLIEADPDGAVIEFDGVRRELRPDGRISGGFPDGPAPKIVRLVPGSGGHYFVDGQINGNAVRFLVDTGATSVAMNKHTARRIGIPYKVDGRRGSVRTASGIAAAYGVTLDEVKVHSLTLRRVPATIIDGDYPGEVLLGQSFLNRLDIHREGAVLELRER